MAPTVPASSMTEAEVSVWFTSQPGRDSSSSQARAASDTSSVAGHVTLDAQRVPRLGGGRQRDERQGGLVADDAADVQPHGAVGVDADDRVVALLDVLGPQRDARRRAGRRPAARGA